MKEKKISYTKKKWSYQFDSSRIEKKWICKWKDNRNVFNIIINDYIQVVFVYVSVSIVAEKKKAIE